jgi:hypothetical protein
MPEHLRALVVILVLSGLSFWLMRPAVAQLVGSATFQQWRNLWLGLTLVAFFSHSFWIYALVVALVLLLRPPRIGHVVGVWLLLLFLVPPASIDIPGLGIINFLFTIDHLRLLSLVLLLPTALVLLQKRASLRLGSTAPDKLLLGFLLLAAVLQLREANITSTLRGCFYLFTDVFLPYYVASRSLRSMEDFKHALTGFLMSTALLAAFAMFETLRHWNLYAAIDDALGTSWGLGRYLGRAGLQRASASPGQPIVLGYVLAMAIGALWWLKQNNPEKKRAWLGGLVLTGGLLATLSKGPWLGAMAMVVIYLALGPKPVTAVAKVVVAVLLVLPVLTVIETPGGFKAIDLLPFIGTQDVGSLTYREQLLENALIVIERNFWLGSVDYLYTPEMQRMIQGEGIIDLVNSYIQIALRFGVIGLALFVWAFVLAGLQVLKRQRACVKTNEHQAADLGRALLTMLAGTGLIIYTVSSISVIPWVYWTLLGICVAYGYGFTPSKTNNQVLAGGRPSGASLP